MHQLFKPRHMSENRFWTIHLAKSYILKLFPKHTCYTINTVSDVYMIGPIFAQFTYFPQDVSETHTWFHSTKLKLILRSVLHLVFSDVANIKMILKQRNLTLRF